MNKTKSIIAILALLLLQSCAVIRLSPFSSSEIRENTLMGQGDSKVLLIDVSGVLSFDKPWSVPGMPGSESQPSRIRADLDRARKDSAIKAILLRIDSPGGTVTASDVIHHEIRAFSEEKNIPVVAVIIDKGLSGGYYAALAADEIFAHPTSLVGSVGVYVPKFDASQLMNKWGIKNELTKSGDQKDILSPWRAMTPKDRETVAGIVDELNDRFQQTVRTARNQISDADMKVIASAAPFTARKALELNMIDKVGYIEDAFKSAQDLAGISSARLVTYKTGESRSANPYSLFNLSSLAASATPTFIDPLWIETALRGGVYY